MPYISAIKIGSVTYDIKDSSGGGGSSIDTVDAILYANAWVDGEQTIIVQGMTDSKTGVVGVSSTATKAERTAAREAMLASHTQASNQLSVVADGTVPSINIPVTIQIIDGSASATLTLLAADWVDGEQTLTVPEELATGDGVIGIPTIATKAERTAAREAMLAIQTQTTARQLTIVADGTVPSIDIPVTVIAS